MQHLNNSMVNYLSNKWEFVTHSDEEFWEKIEVDIQKTNEKIVLNKKQLNQFTFANPDNPLIPDIREFKKILTCLSSAKVGILILCGGLGTRSKGRVNPLLLIKDKKDGKEKTLLDLKLERIKKSPFSQSKVLVLASELNGKAIKIHLRNRISEEDLIFFEQDLVPRLKIHQSIQGPVSFHCDKSGQITYNPSGHFDALRSLVVKGFLAVLKEEKVLMISSYSNWGKIFNRDSLLAASYVVEQGKNNSETCLFIETTLKPSSKKTGSALVTELANPDRFLLVKYDYGRGSPILEGLQSVLMSTNTIYIHIDNLIKRLLSFCKDLGLPQEKTDFLNVLKEIGRDQKNQKLETLFDLAFPVPPKLCLKVAKTGDRVIQIERDFDQISLVPQASLFKPIKVGPERSLSIKLPTDLAKINLTD